MKVLKTYYAKMDNMGDLLNEYIIPKITDMKVIHCENIRQFQLMGIGSCGGAIWKGKEVNDIKHRIKDFGKQVLCCSTNEPCAIWGTGFFKDFSGKQLQLIRKNTNFIALRGKRTKEIVEKNLGRKINPVLCDGGILISDIRKKSDKKYSVGIIPHRHENELFKKHFQDLFEKKYQNMKIIDLTKPPMDVIDEITQCDIILSCSLHGCVTADSYGIPNLRIKISSLPGTGYKFDDYYSSFNLEVPAYDITKRNDVPDANYVYDHYQIAAHMVEIKKREMRESLMNYVQIF